MLGQALGSRLRGNDGYERVSSCGDGGGGGFGGAGLFDPRFAPMLDSMSGVVSVAKWLRRQVVALEIEGSNPFAHPTHLPHPFVASTRLERQGVQCVLKSAQNLASAHVDRARLEVVL